MRYWEFLIQQEGDQTWLPLETRQGEILEGRYRMAAHTSYDDTSVEVRVSQLLLDEIPPRRRVRKRRAVTNDSGLLAIFPFMQLSPGHWEIDCNSPDVIDDFLGEAWHYSVQLQVMPRDEDDWAPDWSEAISETGLAQLGDVDIDGPKTDGLKTDSSTPDPATDGIAQADVQLQLKQQAYVAQLGQTLTLAGQLLQSSERAVAAQLWVQLRDPQTASTLQEIAFDLPKQSLPSPFSVTVTLPDQLSTQVILGAISLIDREQVALASASFTVTIGLAQMLDAIANQSDLDFEEEISIFPGTTEAFVPPAEKAETLLTRETLIIPKEIIPSEGLTLPPQLNPPATTDSNRQPELPTFPEASQPSPAEEAADAQTPTHDDDEKDEKTAPSALVNGAADDGITDAIVNLETEIDEPETDPEELGEQREAQSEPPPFATPRVFELDSIDEEEFELEFAGADAPLSEISPVPQDTLEIDDPDDLEITPNLEPPDEINSSDIGVAKAAKLDTSKLRASNAEVFKPKHPYGDYGDYRRDDSAKSRWNSPTLDVDRAFQKLQLQERFWRKLNLLTQDGYRQSLEVKKALDISDIRSEGNPQSNEFVVYDSPPYESTQQAEQRTKQSAGTSDEVSRIQVMPPTLDVPNRELTAGDWVAIRVRVPVSDYKPYVKVWMNDLQTRTLIDAPRLLMQFTPNDFNELETLMRIKVPTGCLELQFAAISIDMSSLQESRKVVQNRRVMPPDDSLSVFDDWRI
ncbi:MAG: hypothetical protein AAF572_13630 [Cyanobacteria bacterium P01_B01_bin.77]